MLRTKHLIVLTVIVNPAPDDLYVTAPGTLPIFVPTLLDIKKGIKVRIKGLSESNSDEKKVPNLSPPPPLGHPLCSDAVGALAGTPLCRLQRSQNERTGQSVL